MDPVVALLLALDEQVKGAHDLHDFDAPSRCEGWTVGDVLAHSVGVTRKLAAFARGDTDQPHTPNMTSAVDLDAVVAEARVAWREVDRRRVCRLPFGTYPAEVVAGLNLFDVLAHTWDVGVTPDVPDTVWRCGLDAARIVIGTTRDLRHYAPAIDVAPDAALSAQLLAFLGRDQSAFE